VKEAEHAKAHSSVSIEFLADKPELMRSVGEIRWKEWGHAPEEENVEWWIGLTEKETGRDDLPVTWVAVDESGRAVGAVGLGEFDIDERRDRSPWVLGMIVDADRRNGGSGRSCLRSSRTGPVGTDTRGSGWRPATHGGSMNDMAGGSSKPSSGPAARQHRFL
jgi:hypothetical protein